MLKSLAFGVGILPFGMLAPLAHAQEDSPIFDWGGTVEVSRNGDAPATSTVRIEINEGDAVTYYLRLSQQPVIDPSSQVGWWVRVHANGQVRNDREQQEEVGLRWTPSTGWEFPSDNSDTAEPTPWRGINITAIQDDDSDDEFVTFTHEVWDESSNCPPRLHGIARVTVRVVDDEGDGGATRTVHNPGITLSTKSLDVVEDDTSGKTYTVELDERPTGNVRVRISGHSGTDVRVDRSALTFTGNNWNQSQTVRVTAVDDDDSNQDPVVRLNHDASGGGYDGVSDFLEVTITDNDAPFIELSVSPGRVSEGVGSVGISVAVTAAWNGPTRTSNTDVDVRVVSGTAQEGTDFDPVSGFRLTIPTTQTSAQSSFTLVPVDDEVVERDESVEVAGTAGATMVTSVFLVIEDNDSSGGTGTGSGSVTGGGTGGGTGTQTRAAGSGGLEMQPRNARAPENTGNMVFTVDLSGTSTGPVSVRWTTADRTATAGADYTAASGTLTIPAGAASGEFEVPILNDLLDEHDETFLVRFDRPSGAGLASTEAVGTIEDDDGETQLFIEDVSAPEGDGRIGFLVFLASDSGRTVSVNYATRAVSAIADTDYRPTSGTLTIPPGSDGERIWVTVLDDALDEGHETVEMVLSRLRYAVAGDLLAVGTIEDDDAEPQPGVPDVTVAERSGGMEFVVTLDTISGKRVTWDYRTVDGTATAGEDFDGLTGTLTFEPGETRDTLPVAIVNDVLDEADEDFHLRLTNPREPGSPAVEATAVIVDDDDNAIVADAWVSRFGRTVASQVVDAVGDRFANPDGPGSHFVLGSGPMRSSLGFGGVERYRRWMPHGTEASPDRREATSLGFDAGRILSGSSFVVQSQEGPSGGGFGGRWTAWGRGSYTEFDGLDPGVGLSGEVSSVTAGFDVQSGRLTGGLALAGSVGTGDYHVGGTAVQSERMGKIWSILGSAHPYVHVSLAEWLRVWGLGGIGAGTLRISGGEQDADLHMRMWAFGGRGDLPLLSGSGIGLAVKSDIFWVELESDATHVRRASVAEAQRTRLLLEGSFQLASIGGGELSPLVEAGFRQDAGDAESGQGLEVASGLRYRNRDRGLSMEMTGRSLVSHEDERYREWGLGGSLRLDPGPDYLGLAVRLHSVHGAAASTVQHLWSDTSAVNHFPGMLQGRHEAEIGYGFETLRGGAMVIPFSGFVYSPSGTRSFRFGSRMRVGARWALSLQADRSRYAFHGPSYGLVLRGHLLPEVRAVAPDRDR